MPLFFCQYHTVLMTVALWYSLKSGTMIAPAPFYLSIVLAIQGPLCFCTSFKFFCSNSVKNTIGN